MLVGEAGGKSEHYAGRPFCGKSGQVMTAYLKAAGVPRPNVYITNVYPFWPGEGNPDPTPEQIQKEEWRLVADIKRVRPKVIGAVGRIAAQWFLGNDVTMADSHGIARVSPRAPGALVVPVFHPAHGFYDPEMAAYSQDDFFRFALLLKNPVRPKRAPRIRMVYHRTAPEVIKNAAVDTEGLANRPWGISWSKDGRTTHVWEYREGKRLPKIQGRIAFHHALHDLAILRAMGIDTSRIDYDDTMVMLFDLQLEPQGLKAAAYRHLGLKMKDFDEVVRPHFDRAALAWLKKAAEFGYPKPEPIPVADYAKRCWRIYSPQSVGRRIANLVQSYEKEHDRTTLEGDAVARGLVPAKVKLEKRWAQIGESAWVDQTADFQWIAEQAMGSRFPDFSIFLVPKKKARAYSGLDAGATRLLPSVLHPLLTGKGLEAVYEMDRKALPFVDRMQQVGMRVDVERMRGFEGELEGLRERARKKVQRIVGDRWFNPGSSDQVANWLYSLKGLPILSYTEKGRGSTSDGALQQLRGYHAQDEDVAEFLTGIQDYRETDKYLCTHLALIKKSIVEGEDGWRIHEDFRTTRVVSGRLANWLLTIPVKTDLGRKFRYLFVARPGWVLIDSDLGQLELRVGAHYSRDARMRKAFEDEEDLHALTASILFRIALANVSSIQRYVAKTINFAVFYGIMARALLENLYKAGIFDFDLGDCERFIRDWFATYARVRAFQERLWAQAEKDGFVRTMFGRICYVPNLRVMDEHMREAAQRLAANFPVQGSGSDVLKRAEIRLYDTILEIGAWDEILPWLQMHDELLVEVPERRAEEAKGLLEAAMVADQAFFSVPIKAEAKVGRSWGDAK